MSSFTGQDRLKSLSIITLLTELSCHQYVSTIAISSRSFRGGADLSEEHLVGDQYPGCQPAAPDHRQKDGLLDDVVRLHINPPISLLPGLGVLAALPCSHVRRTVFRICSFVI